VLIFNHCYKTFLAMRYFIVIIAAIAIFAYLYKRAFEDFRAGYEEGKKIGNELSKKKRPDNAERSQETDEH